MKIADFYTSGQAAKLLGVTRITIWRWVKSNRFDVQYAGRQALIPRREIDVLKEEKQKRQWEFRNKLY